MGATWAFCIVPLHGMNNRLRLYGELKQQNDHAQLRAHACAATRETDAPYPIAITCCLSTLCAHNKGITMPTIRGGPLLTYQKYKHSPDYKWLRNQSKQVGFMVTCLGSTVCNQVRYWYENLRLWNFEAVSREKYMSELCAGGGSLSGLISNDPLVTMKGRDVAAVTCGVAILTVVLNAGFGGFVGL